MNVFPGLRDAVDGYKMYIVAFSVLLVVFVEKFMGWDVPGVEVGADWMNYVWVAMGAGAWRSAVAKVE